MSASRNKPLPLNKIRNLGIIAHIDAGKTTLTERMLYVTGRTHKIGEVHEGEAVMDFLPQEQERGITITSAATTFEWKDYEFHLIDTPGHVDFTIEVARSLRVLDGAVVVLDGVHGVEPQSETVWRQADRHEVPRVVVVNKLDRMGADFGAAVETLRTSFTQIPIPIQLPIGIEKDFVGYIDLIEGCAYHFDDRDPRSMKALDEIPGEYGERFEEGRNDLIEALADFDDDIATAFLEGEGVGAEQIREALREQTLGGSVVPVLCASALRNKGITPILDAVVAFLPSPAERPPVQGFDKESEQSCDFKADPKGPLLGLLFKVQRGADGRRLCFARIYSGTLKSGETLHMPGTGVDERVARIFLMHANKREQRLERVSAGHIVALLGLRKAITGDTLCAPGSKVLLERIDTYRPVLSLALETAVMREREELSGILERIADEDPTFAWKEDSETGQLVVSGMGELHLEVTLDRIQRREGIQVRAGKPMVLCKETIRQEAKGAGHFEAEQEESSLRTDAQVTLRPITRDEGYRVLIPELVESKPAVAARVRKAVVETLESGPLNGDPIVDVEVEVSSIVSSGDLDVAAAIPIALANAVRDALGSAGSITLAPLMSVEVITPSERVGEVIASLNARKAIVGELEEGSGQSTVRATAYLSEMFGYATDLRSLSQGRASFTMQFNRYGTL